MALDTYVIQARVVDAGGKPVAITPLRVRQIPAFVRAIGPASALLMDGRIADAVALHGDGIVVAMAVATDESEDWLGDLLPDAFLELVSVVMEVNGDFFARRVAPLIKNMEAKAMAATKAMSGATSSPPSSDTATA